jgi:hypothetical protein
MGDLKFAAERQRYQKAVDFVTHVFLTGGPPVFSPIVYCHPFAVANKMPVDAEYWMKFNMAFLRKAEALFVLRIQGWEKSKGLQIEMNVAKMLDIPIVHYNDKFEEVVLP